MLDREGLNRNLGPQVAAAHRTALMIVMSLAMSVGVFIAAGLLLGPRVPETKTTITPVPFYAMAIFFALGSIIFSRTQMHRIRLQAVALRRGPEGLIRHFVTTTIVSAALAEIIGVLGLVGSMLTGESDIVVRLGVVALAIIFYNYPRRGAWQKAVEYYAASTVPGTK